MTKSTVDQIRDRFDHDVDRFSNLDTGQSATMDAVLCLDLVTRAAAMATPDAKAVLDIGCGAGNFTLRLLQRKPGLDCTLLDLSQPMLDRAKARVAAATAGSVRTLQQDVRDVDLPGGSVDIILAAAVLHHLRNDAEWRAVFAKLFAWLRPGGSVWIFDMVDHETAAARELMAERYRNYLTTFGNAYREKVLDYIAAEDTPTPLTYQLNLLQSTGFTHVDILHKHGPFAAFGGIKPA